MTAETKIEVLKALRAIELHSKNLTTAVLLSLDSSIVILEEVKLIKRKVKSIENLLNKSKT